jgi:hypothetical protein
VLLYHPCTIAFYHDAGADLTQIPAWELAWAATDTTTTVLDTDPWRFEVRVPFDDRTLVVELDGALEIVASTQEPRGTSE